MRVERLLASDTVAGVVTSLEHAAARLVLAAGR